MPTRIRARTCETSPTTPPAASSKQEDSDPNYTPNYEEPVIELDPRHRCPPDRAPGLTLDVGAGLTAGVTTRTRSRRLTPPIRILASTW